MKGRQKGRNPCGTQSRLSHCTSVSLTRPALTSPLLTCLSLRPPPPQCEHTHQDALRSPCCVSEPERRDGVLPHVDKVKRRVLLSDVKRRRSDLFISLTGGMFNPRSRCFVQFTESSDSRDWKTHSSIHYLSLLIPDKVTGCWTSLNTPAAPGHSI